MKKFLLITLCLLGLSRPLHAEELSCTIPDNPQMDGIIKTLQNGQTLTEEQMITVFGDFLLFFKKIDEIEDYKIQKKILYYYYHNQPELEGINIWVFIADYKLLDLIKRCDFGWLFPLLRFDDTEQDYALCQSGRKLYCSYKSVWPPLE